MFLRRASGAALAAALCACGAPGATDAGRDAGTDSGRDAGFDAGRDAGPRDAGVDAGVDAGPNDPGWVPMPGLPGPCQGLVERASYPERLYAPRWGACDPPMAGCRQETPWDGRGYSGISGYTSVGGHDGVDGYVVWGISDRRRSQAWIAIARADGGTIGAWRYPLGLVPGRDDVCFVGAIAVDDGYASFNINYFNQAARETSRVFVYHAPVDEIGALETPTAIIPGHIAGYSSPQNAAVSRYLVALEMQPGGFVYVVTPDGTQQNVSGPLAGVPQGVGVVGDQIFWEDWGATVRMARAGASGPGEILWDAAPGEVRSAEASAEALAWIQGYDRPPGEEYQRMELWTALVPAAGAPLEPRMVRQMAHRGPAFVGGGYYISVAYSPSRQVELVELSTGRTKSWPIPPRHSVLGPAVYATERDVMIVHQTPDGNRLVRLDPTLMPYDDE